MTRNIRIWVAAVALAAGGPVLPWPCARAQDAAAPFAAPAEQDLRPAFTLPYKTYQAHFPTLGVIKAVNVKEGDRIKKGDVVMKQDDSEELAELKVLDAAILQSAEGIKVAAAKLRVAAFEYEAKKKLHDAGGQIELEVKRTEAERDVAAAQLEQARADVVQATAKRDKQAIRVEEMTMKSEVDGVVKDLVGDLGSNTDPTRPVITVVENNPLLVEVQVPALASLRLKKGEKMRVSYDKRTWREGSVSFLSPQADAGSGMRMIRLELPNPDGEPSGLQVFVEMPDKLLAGGAPAGAGAAGGEKR